MNNKKIIRAYQQEMKDMRRLAEAGRPDLLLKTLLEQPYPVQPSLEFKDCLAQAFTAADGHSPEQSAAAFFQRTLAMYSNVQIRLYYILTCCLREWDESGYCAEAQQHIFQRFLPFMERIEKHFLLVVKQYAAAKRALHLPDWPADLAGLEAAVLAASADETASQPQDSDDTAQQAAGRVPCHDRVRPVPGSARGAGLRIHEVTDDD